MKSLTRRLAIAGVAVTLAVTACAGIHSLKMNNAFAETTAESSRAAVGKGYFYNNLSDLSKKFYDAFDTMFKDGDFKDGQVNYDVIGNGIASADQIEAWAKRGDLTVPKAFSAARDAFLTDHPEIFYIDFYKLTISVGMVNGAYTAFIDCGREENAYFEGGFNSVTEVDAAITKFDAKVDEIVAEALAEQAKDTYSEKDVFLARYVNKYIADNVKYDNEAYENRSETDASTAWESQSAYGALIENKSVCAGYAKSYKTVMDKLGIPCIVVNGYGKNRNSNGEPGVSVFHAWNYVYLADVKVSEATASAVAYAAATAAATNGSWYSVDATWNSSAKNKAQYAILSGEADNQLHDPDGVISSSGYKLAYPLLADHAYGVPSTVKEGLDISAKYEATGTTASGKVDFQYFYISYNGKSVKKLLQEDNLHIAYRYYYRDTETAEMRWQQWMGLGVSIFADVPYTPGVSLDDYEYGDNGVQSKLMTGYNVEYTQFAVFGVGPDVMYNDPWKPALSKLMFYSDKKEVEENILEVSEIYVNEAYGTFNPAPFIQTVTPPQTEDIYINDGMRDPAKPNPDGEMMDMNRAFDVTVTYNEPLHILDGQTIKVYVVSKRSNVHNFISFPKADANGKLVDSGEMIDGVKYGTNVELVEGERWVNNQKVKDLNTLKFKFCPSLMYEHDGCGYYFLFTGVGSAQIVDVKEDNTTVRKASDKSPLPPYIDFCREYVQCPACFNYDGRIWIDCVAQPSLVDTSDLSAMNFKDEDGESTFTGDRSQMMLVVDKYGEQAEKDIKNEIVASENTDIKAEDIKSSETYEIKLSICGKYKTISDGSYVKIALGFPEGYGPNDEGTTFKLFHRKHIQGDEYIIEEVPCVVTQFGIVATVTSFSPYTVVAVPENTVKNKTVYASIEGRGGKLSKEDGEIKSLKEGESYTYKFVPDSGYLIHSVTLNGVNITDKVDKYGKLTVKYDELKLSNEIEVRYIAEGAVERVRENGVITPAKVVVNGGESSVVAESMATPSEFKSVAVEPSKNNNLPLIITLVVVAVLLAVILLVLILVLKKRKAAATASAAPAKSKSAEPAAKSKPASQPAAKSAEAKQEPSTKTYHISKRKDDGKWQVKAAGGEKALKLFDTQAQAIEYAKKVAGNQDANIMIHKEDGSFRRLSYK